jgi:hypothetical protein
MSKYDSLIVLLGFQWCGGVVKHKKNKNKHETNNNPVSIKIFREEPF